MRSKPGNDEKRGAIAPSRQADQESPPLLKSAGLCVQSRVRRIDSKERDDEKRRVIALS